MGKMFGKRKLDDEMILVKRTGIFITILVSGIAGSMLSTALTTALPQIMKDFQISSSTGQWLTSVYSLVMGIMILTTPFLLRRCKTKLLYAALLTVFILGLFLSGSTSSFPVMMLGRVLQAAANGVMVAQSQVMILTIFEKEKRGAVMGIYGLVIGVSPVVAPTVAGIIVDMFGWRMIFYFVLIVLGISLLMTLCTFENVLENAKEQFDFLSLSLCAAGVSGLLLGAGNIGTAPFLSLQVLVPLGIGLVMTSAFVYRQLTMEHPFMELRILKVQRYRTAVIGSVILYAAVMASSLLLPLYIQSVRGYSATISGLATMPGALASALISPVAGRIYDKAGIKKLFITGGMLLCSSNFGTAFLSDTMSLTMLAILNVFRCIGIGCMMMPFVTWGMSSLDEKNTSHGTALITSVRTIAGAFGSAFLIAVVNIIAVGSGQTRGMQVAFLCLGFLGLLEILLAVRVVRKDI